MKTILSACLIAASVLAVPTAALAGEQEEAFANCLKELGGRLGISAPALKTFHIEKSGNGYEVIGTDDAGRRTICKTVGVKVRSLTQG